MKNQVQTIDKEQLTTLLSNVDRGEFVHLEIETEVKMRKTNNPLRDTKVYKYTSRNVRTLPDYEKRVQNVTENENFESKPNWFEHESPCVVHSRKNPNQKYFMYESFDKVNSKTEYYTNEREVEKEELTPFLPPYQEREINVFTVKVDNIKKLSYKGVKYEVE